MLVTFTRMCRGLQRSLRCWQGYNMDFRTAKASKYVRMWFFIIYESNILVVLQIFSPLFPVCCIVAHACATGPCASVWQCDWARSIHRHSTGVGQNCWIHFDCCEADKQQYSFLVYKLVWISCVTWKESGIWTDLGIEGSRIKLE